MLHSVSQCVVRKVDQAVIPMPAILRQIKEMQQLHPWNIGKQCENLLLCDAKPAQPHRVKSSRWILLHCQTESARPRRKNGCGNKSLPCDVKSARRKEQSMHSLSFCAFLHDTSSIPLSLCPVACLAVSPSSYVPLSVAKFAHRKHIEHTITSIDSCSRYAKCARRKQTK